eukprot:s10258_g3.t1
MAPGLFWPLLGGPLRLRAATAVRRGLRFDAPAVVSHESPCVSTLPLHFAFRRSRCGFARIPACSGCFCSMASSGKPLRLRAATAHAVGRGLRFDAFLAHSSFWPALLSWDWSSAFSKACESSIEVSHESGLRGEKVWAQIAVKDMSRKPHYFSEYFNSS